MTITFKGNPVQLKNKMIQVGDELPTFTLRTNTLQDICKEDITNSTLFIVVPSIDTPVCDVEIKRFSDQLKVFKDVKVYGVSMDLPFAQSRWCLASSDSNIELLSDYLDHSFGLNTGTYIEGLGILSRAIILVNNEGKIVYTQFVQEVSEHPNYDEVFEAVKKISA